MTATGFSQTSKGMLSIGAEVGNSGTHIAYDTSLVFHAYDSGHADVLRSKTVTIPVILPGQRVPVGLPATSLQDLAWRFYPKVRSVRVTLTRTQWLPTIGVGEFPRVSVRVQLPVRKILPAGMLTALQLAGDTNACVSEPATEVGIVYRNSTGAIVGGAVASTGDVTGLVAISGCVAGGFHGAVYAYGALPSAAVPSRTDVALYCDPAKTVQHTADPVG
ncbi:hypothetical protein [Actinoplanes subtropicus]|uniref:hypothetical protein n=1 Tax=Actinoplanes subtropicus TaxID=543632 RepID=UPI0004C386B7|nr:hypothetical protein [Actinoplanes subtropicus]